MRQYSRPFISAKTKPYINQFFIADIERVAVVRNVCNMHTAYLIFNYTIGLEMAIWDTKLSQLKRRNANISLHSGKTYPRKVLVWMQWNVCLLPFAIELNFGRNQSKTPRTEIDFSLSPLDIAARYVYFEIRHWIHRFFSPVNWWLPFYPKTSSFDIAEAFFKCKFWHDWWVNRCVRLHTHHGYHVSSLTHKHTSHWLNMRKAQWTSHCLSACQQTYRVRTQ